jgi:2-amino-4-hydroxy-6-hydroxymethyldihydropteridine diphosphokinase
VSGSPRSRAFLSLGSNVGDREGCLAAAREALAALPGTELLAASRIYETAPQERRAQPEFLNQVVCIATGLKPFDLLHECQRIERDHGRTRGLRFGPRTLDIDILVFQGVESDHPDLTLPHPRMLRRAFVLVPLAEIWDQAEGMPSVDVAALAEQTARDQVVRVYHGGHGSGEADR